MIAMPDPINWSDPRWRDDFQAISFKFAGMDHVWSRGYWQKYILTDTFVQVVHAYIDPRTHITNYAHEGVYLSDITELKID